MVDQQFLIKEIKLCEFVLLFIVTNFSVSFTSVRVEIWRKYQNIYQVVEIWLRRFIKVWRQGGAANMHKICVILGRRPFFGQEIAKIKTITMESAKSFSKSGFIYWLLILARIQTKRLLTSALCHVQKSIVLTHWIIFFIDLL